mgnify:CR=1 FL=1
MGQIADRFKVLMLDTESRLGASMIARGGCYWRNGSGGMAVAHDGTCIQLSARQANQIRTVLPIESTPHAARLPRETVKAHLKDLLDAQVAPASITSIAPSAESTGRRNVIRQREVC